MIKLIYNIRYKVRSDIRHKYRYKGRIEYSKMQEVGFEPTPPKRTVP